MVAAVVVFASASGCGPGSAPGDSAPRLSLGASWKPVDPESYLAPGRRLAAWSGPEGASLVVYRTVPDPSGTAESVLTTLANRFANLPGYEIVGRRVEDVAGTRAARVEVVAPGTGSETAPSGLGRATAPEGKALTPTREVTLGFPRPDGSLFLVWRMPEAARDKVQPEVATALASMSMPPLPRPAKY